MTDRKLLEIMNFVGFHLYLETKIRYAQ